MLCWFRLRFSPVPITSALVFNCQLMTASYIFSYSNCEVISYLLATKLMMYAGYALITYVWFFSIFPFTQNLYTDIVHWQEKQKMERDTLFSLLYSLMKKGILWESKNYEKKIVGSTSRSPLSQPPFSKAQPEGERPISNHGKIPRVQPYVWLGVKKFLLFLTTN
jgi:hypothetical protein